MKKTLIFLYTVLLPLISVQAQRVIPTYSYMNLTGTLNNESSLTIHLSKANDTLFGDYIIEGPVSSNEMYSDNNQPRQVFGKMDKNGTFWLKEWGADEKPVFKGRMGENQRSSCIWESTINKGKQLSIILTEKYPDGTLPLNLFYESDSKMLVKETKSPTAIIKLALLLPADKGNYPNKNLIRNILSEKFANQDCKPGEEAKLLQSMKRTFFENYFSTNESFYKEFPGESFSWESLKFTHLVYNKNYRMSFYILSYSYTGGAHGEELKSYTTVDLKTGKILTLADVFKSGYESNLSGLLTLKLQTMSHLKGNRKLTDSGFFVDELVPTENFYLSENGVGFVYNQYEIAPYAFGQTEIFLTRDELKQLLK